MTAEKSNANGELQVDADGTVHVTAYELPQHGLPAPGAIGIFGAGTSDLGDSAYFGAIGMGQRPLCRCWAD